MSWTVKHPAARACILLPDGTLAGNGLIPTQFDTRKDAMLAVLRTLLEFGFQPIDFEIVPLGDSEIFLAGVQ